MVILKTDIIERSIINSILKQNASNITIEYIKSGVTTTTTLNNIFNFVTFQLDDFIYFLETFRDNGSDAVFYFNIRTLPQSSSLYSDVLELHFSLNKFYLIINISSPEIIAYQGIPIALVQNPNYTTATSYALEGNTFDNIYRNFVMLLTGRDWANNLKIFDLVTPTFRLQSKTNVNTFVEFFWDGSAFNNTTWTTDNYNLFSIYLKYNIATTVIRLKSITFYDQILAPYDMSNKTNSLFVNNTSLKDSLTSSQYITRANLIAYLKDDIVVQETNNENQKINTIAESYYDFMGHDDAANLNSQSLNNPWNTYIFIILGLLFFLILVLINAFKSQSTEKLKSSLVNSVSKKEYEKLVEKEFEKTKDNMYYEYTI